MNQKVIINIFGPPTAGKSTIVELLQEHFERLYTVDFDVVKKQISKYDWRRDSLPAQDITYATLVAAAKTGMMIVVLLPKPKLQTDYERIATAAQNANYRLLNVEITAPEAILVQRYKDRLETITDEAYKQRMKNPEEFKEYIRTPYFKPADTISFDSSHQKPDEILATILGLVNTDASKI